jgi:hypothetical protein
MDDGGVDEEDEDEKDEDKAGTKKQSYLCAGV